MNVLPRLLTAALLTITSLASFVSAAETLLWYDRPGREAITEGLPIGNGRIAALVLGGTARERLVLNESTLWQGGPYDPTHADALTALPEVRKLVFAGKYKEADALAEEKLMGRPKYQAAYQPLGDLFLDFPGHENATNYRRELDLDTATTRVSYRVGDVEYVRETFVSAPDNVLVLRLTANKPQHVDTILSFASQQLPIQSWRQYPERWQWNGGLGIRGRNRDFEQTKGALKFEAVARLLPDGGRVMPGEDIISVRSADSLTVILAAATNHRAWNDLGADPKQLVNDTLDRAVKKGYDALCRDHLADHQARFRRLEIQLGAANPSPSAARPTDERVASFYTGEDPSLAALYVQYGRYLLLGSSRAGGQPANLQGIWNDKIFPPWGSKYTININTEMNYWPVDSANLGECLEPLVKMVEDLSVSGARTAKVSYNARGWVAHHNTDLWRATAPIDGAPWGLWPTGGAWLCLNLWDHYLFTRDRAYLERIYPLLSGASLFFADTLVEDPKHKWLVTCPSISPENLHPAGFAICAGPTMDNVILRALFSATIAAGQELKRDVAQCAEFARVRDRLPPLQIGRAGQLQEWVEDWDLDVPEPHHRHVSHLIALHPGNEISPLTTPDFAKAARRTLELRGDAATGWSLAWKINFWARLHDGDRAHDLLKLLLSPDRTYTNLFDAHPPFQIDGNFGGAAGILEMLVQSQNTANGEIHLLPALPAAWPEGRVSGIRARGGVSVSLEWANGKLSRATLTADRDTTVRVRFSPTVVKDVTLKAGVATLVTP